MLVAELVAFKGPGPVRARFDGRRAIFCTRSKQRVSAAPLHVRGIPVVDLLIARSTPLNEARPSPPKVGAIKKQFFAPYPEKILAKTYRSALKVVAKTRSLVRVAQAQRAAAPNRLQ